MLPMPGYHFVSDNSHPKEYGVVFFFLTMPSCHHTVFPIESSNLGPASHHMVQEGRNVPKALLRKIK